MKFEGFLQNLNYKKCEIVDFCDSIQQKVYISDLMPQHSQRSKRMKTSVKTVWNGFFSFPYLIKYKYSQTSNYWENTNKTALILWGRNFIMGKFKIINVYNITVEVSCNWGNKKYQYLPNSMFQFQLFNEKSISLNVLLTYEINWTCHSVAIINSTKGWVLMLSNLWFLQKFWPLMQFIPLYAQRYSCK